MFLKSAKCKEYYIYIFLLPLYSDDAVWEGIWNQTHLVSNQVKLNTFYSGDEVWDIGIKPTVKYYILIMSA